jgi:hypothetical protein
LAFGDQSLEAGRVDLVVVSLEDIAGWPGPNQVTLDASIPQPFAYS